MLISMTTAKTSLKQILQLNTYCTNTFMCWTNLVVSFAWIRHVTVLLQPSKVDPLTTKYFNLQSFFYFLLYYFLRTPLHGLAVCGLIYLVYLFSSYLSHTLLDFSKTWTTLYIMHSSSTSIAIFRLILSIEIAPQRTLHSRVKDSITHNSIVILSSNFNGRLVC